ncbi:hypothetical protein [Undibacterium pigrum]|uniref:Uncharacterized protein n=1 Tax=Undibacterium pigrum TaxID=401470 RepID=A0A318JCX5_9BURK|nr:hypothetical protein [Undibacterium pigrum]PXX41658.1 hypothetical protein DFR42_107310 [Undibacterium pigrum]
METNFNGVGGNPTNQRLQMSKGRSADWYTAFGRVGDQAGMDYWDKEIASKGEEEAHRAFYSAASKDMLMGKGIGADNLQSNAGANTASNWYAPFGKVGDQAGIDYWNNEIKNKGYDVSHHAFQIAAAQNAVNGKGIGKGDLEKTTVNTPVNNQVTASVTTQGNSQAVQPAQQSLSNGKPQSNEQYINSNGSWIRNPDFDPLAEVRGNGGFMAAYAKDNSIANKMAYAQNGVGNAGYDPEFLRATRRQMDLAGGMDNFFGNTMNSTQEQLNFQNALRGITDDPFAGQNLSDASVQARAQQYMQTHPDYVPVNTYRGEAPRLPGDINQDTGLKTMKGVSNQNPWITNKGFVQQMPWQQPQQLQNPYLAPQQSDPHPYLQPFQRTDAYNKAVNVNWASANQSEQGNWGQQSMQNPYGMGNTSQSMYGNPNNFQNNFQQRGLLNQGQQTSTNTQNRYGLLSAYGTR